MKKFSYEGFFILAHQELAITPSFHMIKQRGVFVNREIFPCRCSRRLKKRPLFFVKKILCFLLFICLSLTLIYNIQIIPALIPLAKANATTAVTLEMQKIIGACVTERSYGDFVKLNYDTNGDVVSLETNTGCIALLTADITESAINSLCKNNSLNVSIPIGNLTGGAIFTGKGPAIDIDITVSKKIVCNIKNEFYESGINQTLHRIIAEVETEVYALVPMSPQTVTVVTQYCIAETVIVGDVPSAYTKINRLSEDDDLEESDIDDIFDFGAVLD